VVLYIYKYFVLGIQKISKNKMRKSKRPEFFIWSPPDIFSPIVFTMRQAEDFREGLDVFYVGKTRLLC
jgi:hypothetical protein